MTFSLETPDALSNRDEVQDIITEFYTTQTERLFQGGGPRLSPDVPISGFWRDIDKFFPPHGALVLARDATGQLLGCGGICDIGEGIAELKYLYVRPAARGTGLGRQLVEARIAIARHMGLSQICVDTLKVSVEMHGLYESMGFARVADFPQSKSLRDTAALAGLMYFYRMNL